MKTQEARDLGQRIAALVEDGQIAKAYTLLAPVLAQRTRFVMLGHIGAAVGAGSLARVNAFLDRIAQERTEGGWVVIGKALGQQLDRNPDGAFDRSRAYIIAADIWYGADILGERVPGPALVADFAPSLARLAPWRTDPNRWVGRAVGVSVHFWAKRARGTEGTAPQATALLDFVEPMFEVWEMDVVKGVGWGLKTLGRYYPDLVADWLEVQVVERQRRHRTLMLRKALTYLPEDQRARITDAA